MRLTDTSAIKSAIDIVEFIGRYVKLRNGYGLCPFHKERTASFHVNSKQKSYHCFGCGAKGDVISFYREVEGVSFPEAVSALAGMAGVQLEVVTARHPQEALVLATEASVWFKNWKAFLVEARNHAYDTGGDSTPYEALYENLINSTPREVIEAYRRVRTPFLAEKLRSQHKEEQDVLRICRSCL